VGPQPVAEEYLPAILVHAAGAPDPDGAVLALARLQDDLGGVSLPARLAADPRSAHDLLFLLGLGHVPAASVVAEPGLLDFLDPDLLDRESDPELLTAEAVGLVHRLRSPDVRRDALRRWKRGRFVGIIARDVLAHEPQEVITREISAVADACTRAALVAAHQAVLGRDVADHDAVAGLAVIAMGKWGSLELNYNSDIDLILVSQPYPDGPSGEQWEKVAEYLARELDQPTIEGRVFRVDYRLRPGGSSGSLVRTLESFAAYHDTQGAAWEVQALTRARYCAGDLALGRQFEELATQLVYGARLGPAGVRHIRENRRKLDDRSRSEWHVKEGPGGIRDIEFTTQLLQLVRGVTDPSVRKRNTWRALDALADAGAISEAERRTLSEAYDFLRRVEHLLQIQPASPTREVPTEAGALRRLARGMGYLDARTLFASQRFLDDYRSHTEATRALCNRLFCNPIPLSSPDADEAVSALLDVAMGDDDALPHLDAVPLGDPGLARRRLLYLAHGEPPMRLPEEVQKVFVALLPALLACIQRMPDPDNALMWFERFVACAGGRALFYGWLVDHPPVIEVLCRIGGHSDYLSQTLVDNPEYLDCVVHPDFLDEPLPAERLRELLAERLAPLRRPELRLDDIRRFRRREGFRIGVRDLLDLSGVETVVSELSDLAEVTFQALLAEVTAEVEGAAGLPFAVIGCGKFGGRELHYSSDLDVLFVYDSPGAEAAELAERLARRLTQEAERRTRAGRLYALDARLRPYGANSPLVRSLTGYERHYEQHGEPWERLALTRVRPVAGDPELGGRFLAVAHAFAYGPPPSQPELAQLRHIKHRIETERRDAGDVANLDPKLEPGGIMDVEFLAQILQIRHGGSDPGLRQANTLEAVAALEAAGHLSGREAEVLRRSYLSLRRLETRLQIVLERSSGLLPLDDDGLAAAAKQLGWTRSEAERRPEQLLADVRGSLRAVREVFEARIGVGE
ncbi:MAG: hypothetical protein HYU66_23260, partial [Armatimonadetes bacterium]|nr:hypothetical protein [Armatimonadota bacterium]